MNPHTRPPISPRSLLRSLVRNRGLLWHLGAREIGNRYRGSIGGVLWSLLQPILMLCLYTFVFALVLRVRWPGDEHDSTTGFALVLFGGLIPFALLSEILNRAPALIVGHGNYVKRVVFPLELLPLASTFGVLVHVAVQVAVWLVALCVFGERVHRGLLLVPLMLLPLAVLAAGLAWLLAGLSVYLRDLTQIVPLLSSALIFLAPIFYPASAVPESMQAWIAWNPLTFVVEEIRAVALDGAVPHGSGWLLYCAVSAAIAWLGYAAFQRMRPGWPDEL